MFKKARSFPEKAGVYLMKDAKGKVVYVGKATNLKNRVLSYFGGSKDSRYQVGAMMKRTKDIEFIVTKTEKQALVLEYDLIQKFRPKYNIMFRDDKSYVKIKLTTDHPFPGIYVTRKTPKDGAIYFGPHPLSTSCRETVDLIARYFNIRTCSDIYFSNRSRPCIQFEIHRCRAPCVGKIAKTEYKKQIESAILFLSGKTPELIDDLRLAMEKASYDLQFEQAAHLRDILNSIEKTVGKKPHQRIPGRAEAPPSEWEKITSILARKLLLPARPRIIACVDISNISGKYASGSIVAFTEGKPSKDRYRIFKIKGGAEPDDYGMMKEVLIRYLSKGSEARPDLILVDGGKGQLMITKKVLEELGIQDVAIAAIAKGRERKSDQIFIPNRKNPVGFRKGDIAYRFLQRIRDEAHRFGIAYYRKRHRKQLTSSELDSIPGIGPARKRALLKEFDSIGKIRASSEKELTKIRGITQSLAKEIIQNLSKNRE